jgi:hypothetical protein
MKTPFQVCLAGVITLAIGLAVQTILALHYKHALEAIRAANKRQLRDVAADVATQRLTADGCSNFYLVVIGQKDEVATGALIESNQISFGAGVKMERSTNNSAKTRQL